MAVDVLAFIFTLRKSLSVFLLRKIFPLKGLSNEF